MLSKMPNATLKQKLVENCKAASYGISDKNTFEVKEMQARDVLVLDAGQPRLCILQVQEDPVHVCLNDVAI